MDVFERIKWSFLYFSAVGLAIIFIYYLVKRAIPLVLKMTLLVIVTGAAILADMYLIEPNWLEVKEVTVRDERLADILAGTRIVQISDIHAGRRIGFREESLVRKVNRLEPDLILITGDFISDLSGMQSAMETVRRMQATIGKFGVPGNNDHYRLKPDGMVTEFAKTGLQLLRNENRRIPLKNGKVLNLVGVDDPVTGHAKIKIALTGVPSGEPVVMMAHSPSFLKTAVSAGVDLLLVGHTHGGQVGIPALVRYFRNSSPTSYISGLMCEGKTLMYVNRGIGMTNKPVRFLCRPEITVFRFVRE